MRKSFHTLGGIVTDVMKRDPYMYHLPFYRQIQQYREYGVSLNDSTVGGWYEAAVEKLKLLYNLRRHKILSSKYIQVRKEESYPVIRAFERWMQASYPKVSLQSRMSRAIAYTYSLLPRLSRYVNDGRINIDNNLIENAIRPLALGRKNYLFAGNHDAAIRAAIIYSLFSSCKAARVDTRIWLEDVLVRLPGYKGDLAGLLPSNWKQLAVITG